jgi:hypothetical protein
MTLDIDVLIEKEFKKIYGKYWNFMKNEYIYYEKLKYHRKKLEPINNINKVKDNIFNKLGSLAPYVFLTDLCSHIYLPGPYNTIDKALILIEHLLRGYSLNEMEIYMPATSFYRLYRSLYITNYDFLDNWINKKMRLCFSSPILRLLCAKKFNPSLVDNITLILDGHHNRIVYQDIFLDKKELYSWKLKKNGLNTQFIIDINKMCVYVSDSLPCKNNNDDNMLLNINMNDFYNETDCICFDGLYENTVKEYIDKYKNIGYNISIHNFCYPIKKDRNIKLTDDEDKFNNILGGFRSKIESYFAELGSIFIRFSGQSKIRITDKKIYNIQLKLAIVLLNIKYFKELFQLEDNNHYNKWREDDFDYVYLENKEFHTNISLKTVFKIEKINDIKELQLNFLNRLTIDNDDIEETSMNIDNFSNNISLGNNLYEIQYIIKHKKLYDKFEYFVKWRNYGKEHNSWVKESDFEEKDILNDYWTSIARR